MSELTIEGHGDSSANSDVSNEEKNEAKQRGISGFCPELYRAYLEKQGIEIEPKKEFDKVNQKK